MEQLFLNLLAFGALFSGILVITAKNPVIAVIFLISVFVNSAGYLILLGIGFIGLAYIIVYVGAITVLFLFVIMLLNIRISEIVETNINYTKNLPLALIMGLLFIFELFTIVPFSFNDISLLSLFFNLIKSLNNLIIDPYSLFNSINLVYLSNNSIFADANFINFIQIQSIGHTLYTFGSIWLIITSLILLLSLIAPLYLTGKPNNE